MPIPAELANDDEPIPVGSIWREHRTGRHIRVLSSGPFDHPHWTYCSPDGTAEPHGLEPANGHRYDDWYDHHCDVHDFVVWDRFEFVRR